MKVINFKKINFKKFKLKGFTLIELLAVIVVLAIIALIATPIIMNVIERSREGSYERSVENILHSADIVAMQKKSSNELVLNENIYDDVKKEINGKTPDAGQVYVNKKGEIALSIKYEDYCYIKSYGEKNYDKIKSEGECIEPFYYLKADYVKSDYQDDQYFLYGPIKRSEIEKLTTLTTNIVPEGVLGSWDVGVDKYKNPIKGKVMAWYNDEDNNGLYEVYIGQEGGVLANPNSSWLFAYLTNLTDLDLSGFDTSHVTNMYAMFHICPNLLKLDVSHFDTGKVTEMTRMFVGCRSLTSLDLSSFDTSKVRNMYQMFNGCNSLTSLNVSSFDTSNVTSMEWMFNSCSSLTTLDVSGFNTDKVIYMANMFRSCGSLKSLDLSSFNTANVTTMSHMFAGDTNLKNILVGKNWNTENIDTTDMFNKCGTDHITLK